MTTYDAAIAGGGIIGLSVAYELAKTGRKVAVVDRGPLHGEAVSAAAGMLGAEAESHHGGAFFEMCKWSRGLYRSWAEELKDRSGVSIEYVPEGIIRAALDEADEAELLARAAWNSEAEWLSPEEIVRMEPEVASGELRGGYYFRHDHQVHPLRLATALRRACAALDVAFHEDRPVTSLLKEGNRVTGLQTSAGPIFAQQTVVAAGSWSSSLLSPHGIDLPVFPVKGQCYSVAPEKPLTRRTLFVQGCYLVPKMDGTIWVGATQEEAGYDKTPTVGAMAALHAKAVRLLPAMERARFVRTWAGLRPGTPDGLPWIGFVPGVDGLLVATGHYRNGILLAPATGRLVKELASGEPCSFPIDHCSPARSADGRGEIIRS